MAAEMTVRLLSTGVEFPSSPGLTSIMNHPNGLQYLRGFAYAFSIHDRTRLSQQDVWVLSCLARTSPSFRTNIIERVDGIPKNTIPSYLDVKQHVLNVNAAPKDIRHEFISSLVVGGTESMLSPLLASGMSLGDDENHYFACAVKGGNVDTANVLLDYGPQTDLKLLTVLLNDFRKLMEQSSKPEGLVSLLRRMLASIGPLQRIDSGHPIFDKLVCAFVDATDLSEPDRMNGTPWKSRGAACVEAVEVFLEAGLLIGAKLPRCIGQVEKKEYGGWARSALALAVDFQNLAVLQLLLKHGYDVEEPDASGLDTPLIYAIKLGLVGHVAVLLAGGADVTKVGIEGRAAWQISALCAVGPHNLGGRSVSLITRRDQSRWPCREYAQREEDYQILALVLENFRKKHGVNDTQAMAQEQIEYNGKVFVIVSNICNELIIFQPRDPGTVIHIKMTLQ